MHHVEARSDEYSKAMDDTMGANATIKGKRLVYDHEEGMNYDLITDDIIVGSCLQVPEDVDRCDRLAERLWYMYLSGLWDISLDRGIRESPVFALLLFRYVCTVAAVAKNTWYAG